jgi:hypothetical protein
LLSWSLRRNAWTVQRMQSADVNIAFLSVDLLILENRIVEW